MIRALFNMPAAVLSALLLTLPCMPARAASLIGDTVVAHYAQYYEPDYYLGPDGLVFLDGILYDFFFPPTEIGPIVIGSADAIMVPEDLGMVFDFEQSGFSFSTNVAAQWGSNPVFNGIVITDITPMPAAVISGFTLTNQMFDINNDPVAFTDDRISFTDDSVFLNFEGLIFFDGNATIELEFTAVPLPPAMLFFGSGLIGLIGLSRRRHWS